jgi:hypothetical protein
MAEIAWREGLSLALDEARRLNRPVFLDFWFRG